jgi:manganese efflux pump family protein
MTSGMSFGGILALAVGLAMDATAVAAARGLAAPAVRLRHAAMVAALFGVAQAAMPLLGWLLGSLIGPLVSAWDHWIAFALLSATGAKMLWEARGTESEKDPARGGDPFRLRVIVALAIATSIDAFAVGVTLPMLGAPLVLSLLTIGVTTALLSGLAVFLGRRFGAYFGRRLDALGGLVLIGLGVKILIAHLWVG